VPYFAAGAPLETELVAATISSGVYKTRRGNDYEYDVAWSATANTMNWSARVKRDGITQIVDRSTNLASGINVEAAVRALAEHAIERLDRAGKPHWQRQAISFSVKLLLGIAPPVKKQSPASRRFGS